MTARLFHAVALTPVHVEDPEAWLPECFVLDGDDLVRFEPAAVMAALDDAARRGFALAVERGDLRLAQDVLHAAMRPEHALERILVGAASHAGIVEALSSPARPGRVVLFARSGGRPCLPGSTVKGALRTALLSARAQPMLGDLRRIAAREDGRGGRSGRLSDEVQAALLGLADAPDAAMGGRDPFRFLRVGDCMPDGVCTRIERVFNRRRDGRTRDMLVDAEVVRAGTRFEMTIAAAAGPDGGGLDLDALLAACDAFHRQRWEQERARFHADAPWPAQPATEDGRPAILLRLGRYAHFEAASIEGLRQGWNHARRETMVVGDTRAVTLRGDLAVPFGWIALFETADAAEACATIQRRLLEPTPRPPRPAPAPRSAAPARRSSVAEGGREGGREAGRRGKPRRDGPGPASSPAQPQTPAPAAGARDEKRRARVTPPAAATPVSRSAKAAAKPTKPQAPARIVQFRRGDRVRDPDSGDIAIVAADVPFGAARMEVDFPDGPMSVDPKGWKKL